MDELTYNVLRRLPGLSLSYEDASLIALAESEGIQDVLSLDNDFRLAGLNLLPG